MNLLKGNKFLTLLILNLIALSATSQVINHKAVTDYFNERITAQSSETNLISFPSKRGSKLKDISESKRAIWQLWKEVNHSIEELPNPTEVTKTTKLESYPVHQWELQGEDPMPYYFIRKSDTVAQKHALFLNLHGSGPKEMEFKNTLSWTLRYEDKPSFYFIPQIPNVKRYRWWLKPVQYSWERLFRLAMLNEMVDVNKIFVMGISEGGYGSQRLAAYYADYLAGAGPMAGGEPLRNAPPLNFRNIAFSFQTGQHDKGFGRNELTWAAKQAFDKLASENPGDFVHKIELQENRGHGIDYTVTTPWLMRYQRRTRPKHVSWMLFPMDGRYRKGFYNVAIDKVFPIQESDEYNRVGFDITYVGNSIHINTKFWNQDMTASKEVESMAISLFLDEQYVDLSKKVKIVWNGKEVHHAKAKLEQSSLIESCALFGDPERLFPAKIKIHL